MNKDSLQNKVIHNFFRATIFLKGIHGIWEIIVGALLFFIKTEVIYKILIYLANQKIMRYQGHLATNYLNKQAGSFSVSTQYFIAVYFFFYGAVNMFLVVSLLKGKLWAYPTAITFFTFFTLYMFYRFLLHHSGILLFFIVFDIFLILLTWLEYGRVKKDKEVNVSI